MFIAEQNCSIKFMYDTIVTYFVSHWLSVNTTFQLLSGCSISTVRKVSSNYNTCIQKSHLWCSTKSFFIIVHLRYSANVYNTFTLFLGLAPINVTFTEVPCNNQRDIRFLIYHQEEPATLTQSLVSQAITSYYKLSTLVLPVCTAHQHQLLHYQNSSQKEHGQTLLGAGMSAVCPTDWEGWVPWELVFPAIDRCINLRLKARIGRKKFKENNV